MNGISPTITARENLTDRLPAQNGVPSAFYKRPILDKAFTHRGLIIITGIPLKSVQIMRWSCFYY